MVRPRKCRRIGVKPSVTYFKPRGIPLNEINEIFLSVEGFEALRLVDHDGLTHEAAASEMRISRQTVGRILSEARQCVARALTQGMALRIRGGTYALGGSVDAADVGSFQINSVKKSKNIKAIQKEEETMIRIAISSEGPGLDDALDSRFGRAAGFVIVDPQTMASEYVGNGSSQTMAQGAGINAAEVIAGKGAQAVLTGYVGPKAYAALEAAGIKIGQNMENMTVRQAVEAYNNGAVQWARQPNRQGRGRGARG